MLLDVVPRGQRPSAAGGRLSGGIQPLLHGLGSYSRALASFGTIGATRVRQVAAREGVRTSWAWADDLSLPLPTVLASGGHAPSGVGLVFIDTLHVYGQLKRELAKFAPVARTFIVLHDTTTVGHPLVAVLTGWWCATWRAKL